MKRVETHPPLGQFAPVVGQIDVCADGSLRWHSDGKPIPPCTGCGNPIYERWRVPEVVWERNRGTAEHLCWPCFLLAMDGADFGPEELETEA